MAGWSQSNLQEESKQGSIGLNTERLDWSSLLTRTYRFYRAHFEDYFPFLLGVIFVACFLCVALDHLSGALTTIPVRQSVFDEPSPSFYLRGKLLGWILWCSEVLVGWIVMTFAFACIAVKVLGASKETQKIPVSRAFRSAMTQFSQLASAALLGTLATICFYSFVLPFLLRPLLLLFFLRHFSYATYLMSYSFARGLILVTFGTLLSRMAPAIPGLLDNPGQSLRGAVNSAVRYTAGRQLFLTLGLGISVGCGFLAYYVVAGDVLQAACNRGDFTPTACSWFLALLAALIIALLAGPTFICFSLLYLEGNSREQASLVAAAR